MTTSPTPQTEFEAWGQGIYRFADDTGVNKRDFGTAVLFAISDVKRQWLGWYRVETARASDAALTGAGSKALGEKSSHPSRFVSETPMTVEELCGPILHSHGGHTGYGSATRQVFIHLASPRQSEIAISLKILRSGLIDRPIRLYTKKNPMFDRIYLIDLNNEWGFVTFLMSEPFFYPTRHINVIERLRLIRRNFVGA